MLLTFGEIYCLQHFTAKMVVKVPPKLVTRRHKAQQSNLNSHRLKSNIKEKSINLNSWIFLWSYFSLMHLKFFFFSSEHEVRAKTKVASYKFPDITPSDHTQRHLEGSKRCSDSAHFKPRAVSHFLTVLSKVSPLLELLRIFKSFFSVLHLTQLTYERYV